MSATKTSYAWETSNAPRKPRTLLNEVKSARRLPNAVARRSLFRAPCSVPQNQDEVGPTVNRKYHSSQCSKTQKQDTKAGSMIISYSRDDYAIIRGTPTPDPDSFPCTNAPSTPVCNPLNQRWSAYPGWVHPCRWCSCTVRE
jgi:hypothetical protein